VLFHEATQPVCSPKVGNYLICSFILTRQKALHCYCNATMQGNPISQHPARRMINLAILEVKKREWRRNQYRLSARRLLSTGRTPICQPPSCHLGVRFGSRVDGALARAFFDVGADWSGAVTCPACRCGGTAAGPNALRGSGPNRKRALLEVR
jgi:hypothetical protein